MNITTLISTSSPEQLGITGLSLVHEQSIKSLNKITCSGIIYKKLLDGHFLLLLYRLSTRTFISLSFV